MKASVKTKVHVKTIFCITSDFYQMRIQQYSKSYFVIQNVIKEMLQKNVMHKLRKYIQTIQ